MSRGPDLDKLRAALSQLHLEKAKQLYAELGAIVQALEQQTATPAVSGASGREVVETTRLGDRLYQLEQVRCGKVGCKRAGAQDELYQFQKLALQMIFCRGIRPYAPTRICK